MVLSDAPICPLRSIGATGERVCQGRDCAWFSDRAGACAAYLLGEYCGTAINVNGDDYANAGIIVKHAPLENDFTE